MCVCVCVCVCVRARACVCVCVCKSAVITTDPLCNVGSVQLLTEYSKIEIALFPPHWTLCLHI